MNDDGFVRLSRRFFQSDFWKERREMSRAEAWLDMIATATWAPETRQVEGRCVNLQRGELAASLRYLSLRWSWSKSRVERFLSALAASGRIRDRIETGTRLITLCNYERYNPARDTNEPNTGPPGQKPGHPRDKVKDEEEPGCTIAGAREVRLAAVETILEALSAAYGRKPGVPATYAEEQLALDVARRPDWTEELAALLDYRKKTERRFFPQSVSALLSRWQEKLDQIQSNPHGQNNPNTDQQGSGNRNAGIAGVDSYKAAVNAKFGKP